MARRRWRGVFVLAGGFGFVALGGCGGLAGGPGGGRRDCIHEGNVYPYDSTFPAGDDCNTCECGAEGEVVCTRAVCFTCESLSRSYEDALRAARACDLKLPGEPCTLVASSGLACGCPTFVNEDSELVELSTRFQKLSCAGPILCGACPEAPVAGACTSQGLCTDVFAETPP